MAARLDARGNLFQRGGRSIGGRSLAGSARGVLAVRLLGSDAIKRDLARLTVTIQRKLLRNAVAASARPVAKMLKQYMRADAAKSPRQESIGASVRSIGIKVGTSKSDPGVAYAKIGARRGYAEIVKIDQTGSVQSISVRRRGKKIRRGVHSVKHRALKNIGPIARKARLNPKQGRTQRRIPTRYLHLIEKGTRRSRAYKFMRAAEENAAHASRMAFGASIEHGITREFGKLGIP